MADIEYKWTFETIEVKSSKVGKFKDVCEVLHWRCTAVDKDDNVSASLYGTAQLAEPSDPFIDFEKITNADCVEWTIGAMPEDVTEESLKENLKAQIEFQRNPPRVNKLPSSWSD
ncbi:MAG: hypothetical protein CMP14_08445 [Rickettsiales bacterium]|mgnify:CR=1 FL=1|nr:hypothetical protein [Rickettsiales bacterium]|tara:strand:+ start:317 stop:661 length:345 start_codon:yes stop_codon:yes gene_type:complete